MVRLDLSYFYRLGAKFDEIKLLPTDLPFNSVWLRLYDVKEAVRQILADPFISASLRGAAAPGQSLVTFLDGIMDREGEDEKWGPWDKNNLVGHINRFEIVLTNELAVADAYFIVEKKPYSTLSLVAEGETLFPVDLPRKVPEALNELREAGKCLAFELPTAAAFHIHRAIELILRRYWTKVTGGKPSPKQRNIGVYLAALKKFGCGDAKVIAALEQLKDLHRNVVMHPDETLSGEDAVALVGMANSIASAMLKVLDFELVEAVPPDDQMFPALETDETL